MSISYYEQSYVPLLNFWLRPSSTMILQNSASLASTTYSFFTHTKNFNINFLLHEICNYTNKHKGTSKILSREGAGINSKIVCKM